MLRLIRKIYTDKTTTGELYFKDERLCWTLEDTVRKLKIPHKTAIPSGQYEVIMSYSNRFKRKLPELLNVPFFKNIRIHSGNTEHDTDGCILVGNEAMKDFITNSMMTLDSIIPIIERELKIGKLYISIIGGYNVQEWGDVFAVNLKGDSNDTPIDSERSVLNEI